MSERPVVVLSGPQLEGLELVLAGLVPGVSGVRALAHATVGGAGSRPERGIATTGMVLPEASMGHVRPGETVTLCDTENTPIAELEVERITPRGRGRVVASGTVRQLREFVHGPARASRLDPGDDLSHRAVAVFSSGVSPADVLRALRAAAGRDLVLIAEGSEDRVASARLVRELQEAAELIPHARVRFVPHVDLDEGDERSDFTMRVLAGLGADRPIDLRSLRSLHNRGAVVVFTGLSGAGKSTVARALAEWVSARTRTRAVLLDGDELRRELAPELGFSPEDRHRNLERQAWVAARVAEAGGLAVCAPIAPFAASRAAMRAKVEPGARFFLIHVATPLAVAESRDRKGLYAQARAGSLVGFTGIDSPYEVPEDADLVIDTSVQTVDACVAAVTGLLARAGVLREAV